MRGQTWQAIVEAMKLNYVSRLRRIAAGAIAILLPLFICSHAYAQLALDGETTKANARAVLDRAHLQSGEKATLAIVVSIPKGLHAQSHTPLDQFAIAFELTIKTPPGVTAGPIDFPAGKIENYPALGKLSVYTGDVTIFVPLEVAPDAKPGAVRITGELTAQLCDEQSCFGPENPGFSLTTSISTEASAPANEAIFREFHPERPRSTTAPATQAATAIVEPEEGADWTLPFALVMAFLAGVVFNVMPCVLPVLPLKAMGFYEVAQHSRARSLIFGLVFGLGVIAIFLLLGLLMLVLRAVSWSEPFSYAWVVWPLVIILVAMSAGLFGAFNITLPSGVYSFNPRHDTYTGNFLYGLLTAILSTPCAGYMLPGVLAAAQALPPIEGMLVLVTVGIGMASPYVVLSAFPELARRFPRSGPWPELVKQMMGFALLVVAIYFAAGRLIQGNAVWYALVPPVAVGCFFLMARTVQLSKATRPVAISAMLAATMLCAVVGFAIYMNSGESVAWQPYTDKALDSALAGGKPVLVKFTANWCGSCQYVEATVFHDPAVAQALSGKKVLTLKADLTDRSAPGWQKLKELYPSGAIPLTAYYPPNAMTRGVQPTKLPAIYKPATLVEAVNKT